MSREPTTLEPALLEWLGRADHAAAAGWEADPPLEALHCHPDLVTRLAEIARPVRGTVRKFVAGCPVIHHPEGQPIAAASGTSWLVVRSAQPAGALASPWHTHGLAPEWVDLDPFAPDVALARGIDLLRAQVARAFELASAR